MCDSCFILRSISPPGHVCSSSAPSEHYFLNFTHLYCSACVNPLIFYSDFRLRTIVLYAEKTPQWPCFGSRTLASLHTYICLCPDYRTRQEKGNNKQVRREFVKNWSVSIIGDEHTYTCVTIYIQRDYVCNKILWAHSILGGLPVVFNLHYESLILGFEKKKLVYSLFSHLGQHG